MLRDDVIRYHGQLLDEDWNSFYGFGGFVEEGEDWRAAANAMGERVSKMAGRKPAHVRIWRERRLDDYDRRPTLHEKIYATMKECCGCNALPMMAFLMDGIIPEKLEVLE